MKDDKILTTILDGVPEDVANLQLPDTELRDYYRDEEERILWIRDEIDDPTLDISRKIFYYNWLDRDIPVAERKPIRIFIDTLGGYVPVMYQIVKVIKMSKTPIWTINWCDSLSAGAHILAAGHKRFAMPGSTVLIHSGSCGYSGTVEQVESSKKYYDAMSKAANELLIKDTKIPENKFKKKASFDWYLTAEEALEYGIVDKIVETLDEIF